MLKYVLYFLFFSKVYSDLRMASTPKINYQVENGNGAIPFVENSIATYMEPSEFNYKGLQNQKANNYDNFLRSNVDNEQDNRDFVKELGRDMLPFRTLEGTLNNNIISLQINEDNDIPLRWNNPHSAECEVNIWLKNNIVVPIKKPSCCAEGYQDNMITFNIPSDFNNLGSKVPGFAGCNVIGDCTLQIYAHSVEPRTYAIGTPLVITNYVPSSNIIAKDNSKIRPQTIDPMENLNILPRDVCLPTIDKSSNYNLATPRFARLVSDQFNHAYQNSDYSPYSGQQHEMISRNMQAATILRMTAANGGELGQSLLSQADKDYVAGLIAKVNTVVANYETTANNIFNKIKKQFATSSVLGNQQLANCFRCSDTGSVNNNRLVQQTYIPSFKIPNSRLATQIKSTLDNKNLIVNNTVQIYMASLKDLQTDFQIANSKGFLYQPAMIKNIMTTMNDKTKFRKINLNGKQDNGQFAAGLASMSKSNNIRNINIRNIGRKLSESETTLPPNPDDKQTVIPSPTSDIEKNLTLSLFNYCGLTRDTIDCNKPCTYGLKSECDIGDCYEIEETKCIFQDIEVTTAFTETESSTVATTAESSTVATTAESLTVATTAASSTVATTAASSTVATITPITKYTEPLITNGSVINNIPILLFLILDVFLITFIQM
jgi:hypothetical protein